MDMQIIGFVSGLGPIRLPVLYSEVSSPSANTSDRNSTARHLHTSAMIMCTWPGPVLFVWKLTCIYESSQSQSNFICITWTGQFFLISQREKTHTNTYEIQTRYACSAPRTKHFTLNTLCMCLWFPCNPVKPGTDECLFIILYPLRQMDDKILYAF